MRTLQDIKFRFYDKTLKEFITDIDLEYILRELPNEGPWENLKDLIPNQYTGLKDKNGKKIYEGDILRSRYKDYDSIRTTIYTDLVEYIFQEVGSNIHYTGFRLRFDSDECEIIGNIYENPELIPKGFYDE